MAIARMRLASQVFEYIRGLDPETALTKSATTKLIKQGKIPITKIGNKTLVNLDHVDKLLENGFEIEEVKDEKSGIRPLKAI